MGLFLILICSKKPRGEKKVRGRTRNLFYLKNGPKKKSRLSLFPLTSPPIKSYISFCPASFCLKHAFNPARHSINHGIYFMHMHFRIPGELQYFFAMPAVPKILHIVPLEQQIQCPSFEKRPNGKVQDCNVRTVPWPCMCYLFCVLLAL